MGWVGVIHICIPKRPEWLVCGVEFKKEKLTGVNGKLCRMREMGFAKVKLHFRYTAGILLGQGCGITKLSLMERRCVNKQTNRRVCSKRGREPG